MKIAFAADPISEAGMKELKALEGEWYLERLDAEGKMNLINPNDPANRPVITIKGASWKISNNDQTGSGSTVTTGGADGLRGLDQYGGANATYTGGTHSTAAFGTSGTGSTTGLHSLNTYDQLTTNGNTVGAANVTYKDIVNFIYALPQQYWTPNAKIMVNNVFLSQVRGLVDDKKLILPWDQELIGEFKGQTFTYTKSTMDMYGRRKTYSEGSFHSLDACRMAALAWKQALIEAGVWDDSVLRAKYIKRYAEYDKNNRA